MSNFDFSEHSHRRLNLLTGEWVQVSPHRAKRPWQGQMEKPAQEEKPTYDPSCYLCPGNSRVGGHQNPAYSDTFVFTNDFSALQPDIPDGETNEQNLLVSKSERGICKVICFSPRHDLTLSQMEIGEITKVIDLWKEQYVELGSLDYINHVQIFENRGEVMGSSNPHPHGQIWAQESIPVEPAKELEQFRRYFSKKGRTLLQDYVELELEKKERVVFANESFVVLVPFWAVWPYETMIIPRRPIRDVTELDKQEQVDFANSLKHLLIKYDNLFEVSFPYSAGLHQRPTDGEEHAEWHFHMHFYPPLLRSATIKKFMVGYEMMANPQRDITAEFSAEKLRSLPAVHYSQT